MTEKFVIKQVKVGFGVTILSQQSGGNVLKYYFEPEIEFEQPASVSSKEELQASLDKMADELITMVQNSVRSKAKKDRQAKEELKS